MILKSQQRFTSEANSIYIEAINKISLSSKGNKRFQTFDRVTSYQYGTNDGKVFLKQSFWSIEI